MKRQEGQDTGKELTPRERAFVLAHVGGANLSDAYRTAYSVEWMKPATVNRRAFDVAHRPMSGARSTGCGRRLAVRT